ncbi:MAG: AAA family ATPase [Bacteroidales bacterium]|nr:AAA family ATPase [Bacteroidales bacterium]
MLNYPIGIQSFEDLRNSKCVYVDKTDYVYNLAYHGKTCKVIKIGVSFSSAEKKHCRLGGGRKQVKK